MKLKYIVQVGHQISLSVCGKEPKQQGALYTETQVGNQVTNEILVPKFPTE
jgi:hypothetical protein